MDITELNNNELDFVGGGMDASDVMDYGAALAGGGALVLAFLPEMAGAAAVYGATAGMFGLGGAMMKMMAR